MPPAGEEEEHGEERRWLARARNVSVPWSASAFAPDAIIFAPCAESRESEVGGSTHFFAKGHRVWKFGIYFH